MSTAPRANRQVTLADIAAACGVSRATVSLVLRASPLVNRHTRARVEAELQRQGYVYNRAAANLRRRTSSSVALVINDLANPFFAEFAAGVDEALGEAGYVTLLGCSNESGAREQAVLGPLMQIAAPAISGVKVCLGSGDPTANHAMAHPGPPQRLHAGSEDHRRFVR